VIIAFVFIIVVSGALIWMFKFYICNHQKLNHCMDFNKFSGWTVFLCLFILSQHSFGQTPEVATFVPGAKARQACIDQTAGTISIRPGAAQSTELDPVDTIFLCYGDEIFINHNNDADLTGDPDPTSPAGIGYAFYYNCPPTVSGDDITQIHSDPCLLTHIPPPSDGIWVARGLINGDVTFTNNGNIQNTYFGGEDGVLWFAPITINDFDNLDFDDGSCVKVNISQAFAVHYLNEIEITDYQTVTDSSLAGFFTVSGGLPAAIGGMYTITIVNEDDPTISGNVLNNPGSGGIVNFDVPQPGLYRITVTDGKGCSKDILVTVPAVDPIGLCLIDTSVAPNQDFCYPVLVRDFTGVAGMLYTISWDPRIIEFNRIENINPILGSSASFDVDPMTVRQGLLPFLWFDLSSNLQSLPDGDTLFEICFSSIGPPGTSTPVTFSNLLGISITDDEKELPFELKEGIVRITEPDDLVLFYSGCPDASGNYAIQIQVFGGQDPYTYELVRVNPTEIVSSGSISASGEVIDIVGVPPDEYDIIIQDAGSSSHTQPIVDIINSSFTVVTSEFDPVCPNTNDGMIQIDSINGGSGNFDLSWSGPGVGYHNINSLSDLGPGNYSLVVRDRQFGCVDSLFFNLAVDTLQVSISSVTPPNCVGTNSGSITATVNSGSGNAFDYRWQNSGGAVINQGQYGPVHTISGLEPGQYFVTVNRDICVARDSVTIIPLKTVSVVLDTIQHLSCNGAGNGRIEIQASADNNVAPPWDFSWSTNTQDNGTVMISGDQSSAFDLPAGTYSVTIEDDQMCQATRSFTITQPRRLVLNTGINAVDQPDCPDGTNGEIDLGFVDHGGTEPYRFTWGDISTRPSIRRDLAAGVYSVTVTDANGCRDSADIVLTSGPDISIFLHQPLVCIGDSIAQIEVLGETAGNEVIWNTGDTSILLTNLPSGVYSVMVTAIRDGETCSSADTIAIDEPVFNVTATTPMSFIARNRCNMPDSGLIFNQQLNYRGPTEYIWHNLNDSVTRNPTLIVRQGGLYRYSVRSRLNGCIIYQDSITATFPDRIRVEVDSTRVSCYGDQDGSVTLSVHDRPGPFNFIWDGGVLANSDTVATANNLAAGTYNFTITDVTDPTCLVPFALEISEPEPLMLLVDSAFTRNIRCHGDTDGQIGLIWEGGNRDAAPSISWSGGVNANLRAMQLLAGTYTVNLTDSKGCNDSVQVDIIEPFPLTGDIPTPQSPVCNGGQTTITVNNVSGGTGSVYTFSVDNGPSQILTADVPVFSGDHLVSIFDALGCRLDTLLNIIDPPEITVDLGDEMEVNLGDSIRLNPVINSMNPIDSFIWSGGNLSCILCSNPFASPSESQMYFLTVIDDQGCIGTDGVLVTVDKARKVFIPNAFSPNDDGINDRFQIFAGNGVAGINYIQIFNRWGSLLFSVENEAANGFGSSGWDGSYDGKIMDPGVYLYLVEIQFVDGKTFLYRGDVTLIR
jgi:gliding motility-associated-like protein